MGVKLKSVVWTWTNREIRVRLGSISGTKLEKDLIPYFYYSSLQHVETIKCNCRIPYFNAYRVHSLNNRCATNLESQCTWSSSDRIAEPFGAQFVTFKIVLTSTTKLHNNSSCHRQIRHDQLIEFVWSSTLSTPEARTSQFKTFS